MKRRILSLLMGAALCVSLIGTAFATPITGTEPNDPILGPQNPTTSPGGTETPPSGGGGGGSYVPPTVPSVTIEKESSGKGTFNVSVGTDKITIVTSPTQGNVVDTITVTDANGNVLTLTKTSENHYECDRPANGGKLTVSVTFKAENYVAPVNPFVDVQPGAYFYNAVLWAVEKGITTGTSATTFSPYETCTRAQTVTFLWRAAGSHAPDSSENPFAVAAGEYYADAVQWAVAQNITNGTSATTFGPSEGCTRGQIVTFLYRAN